MSVLQERRGAIALLVMNKPENRNALSPTMIAALQERLDEIASDAAVRAVVLTGAGVFCSGADIANLQKLSSQSPETNKADSAQLAELCKRIYTFPKPIVAAVEGAAIAGGAGLASACDLIVAGASAKFAYTEVKLGFVAAIVSVFLLRSVGEKQARELLLTGKLVSAEHAQRIGLINEIVPDGRSISRALELALEIAKNSAIGLAATKEAIANIPGQGLNEALSYAVGLNAWARSTEELKEGVAAFLEKREPSWRKE